MRTTFVEYYKHYYSTSMCSLWAEVIRCAYSSSRLDIIKPFYTSVYGVAGFLLYLMLLHGLLYERSAF